MKAHAILTLGIVVSLGHSLAMFAPPVQVPVGRLIKNAKAWAKEHPGDWRGPYTVGRVHYLAFFHGASVLGSHPSKATEPHPPSVSASRREELIYKEAERRARQRLGVGEPPYKDSKISEGVDKARGEEYQALIREGWTPPDRLWPKDMVEHAEQALRALDEAIAMAPKEGLPHNTRAWLIRSYLDWVRTRRPEKQSELLGKFTEADARQGFLRAFDLTKEKDLKLKQRPFLGPSEVWVCVDAGRAWLDMAERSEAKLTKAEANRKAEVRSVMDKLEKLPIGWITPLVFSLSSSTSLAELIDSRRSVRYDLRGLGVAENWPWPKATTAFLVWDPERDARIPSATRMFGSASFQLVFRDGFEALSMLDDDRDGFVRGGELAGLAAWFDRDGDGHSSASEVAPVEQLGIVSLATSHHESEGPSPVNRQGVRMADGRTLPLWDWTTDPLP